MIKISEVWEYRGSDDLLNTMVKTWEALVDAIK